MADNIVSGFNIPDLDAHMSSEHNAPAIKCKDCDFECALRKVLVAHVANGHRTLKCGKCDFVALSSSGLRLHVEATHKHDRQEAMKHYEATHESAKVELNCANCDFVAKSPRGLRRHASVKHKNMMAHELNCSECHFVAKTPGGLRSHFAAQHKLPWELQEGDEVIVKVEFGGGKLDCGECSFVASNVGGLWLHVKTSHNKNAEKDLRCGECDFVGKRVWGLRLHFAANHKPKENVDSVPLNEDSAQLDLVEDIVITEEREELGNSTPGEDLSQEDVKANINFEDQPEEVCIQASSPSDDDMEPKMPDQIDQRAAEAPVLLQCLCGFETPAKDLLIRHVKTNHPTFSAAMEVTPEMEPPKKVHHCQSCDYSTTSEQDFESHKTENLHVRCQQCDFVSSSLLDVHDHSARAHEIAEQKPVVRTCKRCKHPHDCI